MASLMSFAQKMYDTSSPFGWANCMSMSSGDNYAVTGGGAYDIDMPETIPGKKVAILKSTGKDMAKDIVSAINKNDIVILDGSAGDFLVSKTMRLDSLHNKTIIGRNNARLCTQFYLTPELRKVMDDNKVKSYSTSRAPQLLVLPNGAKVKEEREYMVRKIIQEMTHDAKENYRRAGIMGLSRCENIVIRNITFIGPGAIDVGGSDLITVSYHSRHIWIDHCELVDGMDGSLDINGFADFVTVSWCHFRYTERTYDHANTSLVGSGDNAEFNGRDNLNVTYAYCHWGEGCNQRMPMVRFGTVHVLNNYYTCVGNSAAINPRLESEVLTEGCYFAKGVKKMFKTNDAKAYTLKNNYYTEKFKQPADFGAVVVPYSYDVIPVADVPAIVGTRAGVIK